MMDESKIRQVFASRLKNLREEAGLSQGELAQKLGASSRGSISFYEKCDRVPDILFLRRVSEFFNVSTEYLLGISDVKAPDVNIKAMCEYTGLNEKTILKLHEMESQDFCVTKEFIDAFLASRNLERVFERNVRRAIMALIALAKNTPKNGGSIDLIKIREMADGDYQDYVKTAISYDENEARQVDKDLIDGKCVTIGFEDAEALFTNRASGYLDGVLSLYVSDKYSEILECDNQEKRKQNIMP